MGGSGGRISRTEFSCPERAATPLALLREAGTQGGTGHGEMGPGSAGHHTGRCFASPGVLRSVRGTRGEVDVALLLVIASEAKQSRVLPPRDSGLLRCKRSSRMTEHEAAGWLSKHLCHSPRR